MAFSDQVFHKMESLSAVERKEYEELKAYHSELAKRKRERTVFLGFCVVGLMSIMLIAGLLNFDQLQYYIR